MNELAIIEWESLKDMEDVDDMETYWSQQINKCLDLVAPWKTRTIKPKKYDLPKHVQAVIKEKKKLQKIHQNKMENGEIDSDLLKKLKKHSNYCNKLIKKSIREKAGKNITSISSIKDIWRSVQDILKPETLNRNSILIQTGNQLIEDPLELAEKFNSFFKEKVEKLAAGIKKNPNSDPFLHLNEKMHGSNLHFKLKTVSEKEVFEILRGLKPKRSYGKDGISSEILKLGAKVLVVPLTYIINSSILTGKYPTNWKIAKVIPLLKKGDKTEMKNYRPVAHLSVPGMSLERVVAIQIENYFEDNKLLGSFQFGFRKNKSTITELLMLFDTILSAKEKKKEILVLLYDLSAAFDTVCHQTLLDKLEIYGFCKHSVNWMKSYLSYRKQKVEVSGKVSSEQEISIGTPQGSRLSLYYLLF